MPARYNTLLRMTCRQMSFPEMVSDSLCRNSLPGWLVSDDPAGEEAECGGPGLAWLQSVVVRPVGRIAKFFKTRLEVA